MRKTKIRERGFRSRKIPKGVRFRGRCVCGLRVT